MITFVNTSILSSSRHWETSALAHSMKLQVMSVNNHTIALKFYFSGRGFDADPRYEFIQVLRTSLYSAMDQLNRFCRCLRHLLLAKYIGSDRSSTYDRTMNERIGYDKSLTYDRTMNVSPFRLAEVRPEFGCVHALLSDCLWVYIISSVYDSRPRSVMSDPIDSIRIFPPIGIARVGNSDEYYIAPEVPGVIPQDLDFKDDEGKIKRKVGRLFSIVIYT